MCVLTFSLCETGSLLSVSVHTDRITHRLLEVLSAFIVLAVQTCDFTTPDFIQVLRN